MYKNLHFKWSCLQEVLDDFAHSLPRSDDLVPNYTCLSLFWCCHDFSIVVKQKLWEIPASVKMWMEHPIICVSRWGRGTSTTTTSTTATSTTSTTTTNTMITTRSLPWGWIPWIMQSRKHCWGFLQECLFFNWKGQRYSGTKMQIHLHLLEQPSGEGTCAEK